jgi:ABC-type multidrug transport system fused ATPase/permease subunit
MVSEQSKLKNITALWGHLALRRQKQFGLLLLLIILTAFTEVISIGAVLPFLAALTSPERLFQVPILQSVIVVMDINTPDQLLLPMTLFFGLAAIAAASMRLFLIWATTRLSFMTGADIGSSIYIRTLHQAYTVHASRNSSEVISGITRKTDSVIHLTVLPFLNCISYGVILLAMMTILVMINPLIAIGSFGSFGVAYFIAMFFSRTAVEKDSRVIAAESTRVVKVLQEGLGGIRDVLIDGSQSIFGDIFRKSDYALRKSQGSLTFIAQAPRFVVEAFGMLAIATLAYLLVLQPGGVNEAVPILGTLAIGAQRLLPVLQGLYGGWVNMKGSDRSLIDTLELLDQPLPEDIGELKPAPIKFEKLLELKGVSFRYSEDQPWVLENIHLQVVKGERVGIMGPSGGGKSTLLDLIMGLLIPAIGSFEVDGKVVHDKNRRGWQAHIAHVPQYIYLSDASIRENIAFGVQKESIDDERVYESSKQAHMSEFIEQSEGGYATLVGEQGSKLSGGQKQRIGIARALYKRANVLIFDEATSSLDGGTEKEVMNSLDGLDEKLTIFMIAHRLTTLQGCDKIIEIKNGSILRIDSYENMMSNVNQNV